MAAREVAAYWLSLWDDKPPTLAKFNLAALSQHISGIAIMAVKPGESVRCVWAGANYKLGLARDITGADMLAITPPEQRAARLQGNSALVLGTIQIGMRSVRSQNGKLLTQELYLPFAERNAGGVRHNLVFSDWQPKGDDRIADGPKAGLGIAERPCVLSLT